MAIISRSGIMLTNAEPIIKEEDESEPWEPTGSNVLPLGVKVEDDGTDRLAQVPAAVSSVTRSTSTGSTPLRQAPGITRPTNSALSVYQRTAPIPFLGSAARSKIPTTAGFTLSLPPERYLPPSGPYYDQDTLFQIFGHDFFSNNRCLTCWGSPHTSAPGMGCQRICKICGTQDHPSAVRSSLFFCMFSSRENTILQRLLTAATEMPSALLHKTVVLPTQSHSLAEGRLQSGAPIYAR